MRPLLVIGIVGSAVLAGVWFAMDIRLPERDRPMPTIVNAEPVEIEVVAPTEPVVRAGPVMDVLPQGNYASPPVAYSRQTPMPLPRYVEPTPEPVYEPVEQHRVRPAPEPRMEPRADVSYNAMATWRDEERDERPRQRQWYRDGRPVPPPQPEMPPRREHEPLFY